MFCLNLYFKTDESTSYRSNFLSAPRYLFCLLLFPLTSFTAESRPASGTVTVTGHMITAASIRAQATLLAPDPVKAFRTTCKSRSREIRSRFHHTFVARILFVYESWWMNGVLGYRLDELRDWYIDSMTTFMIWMFWYLDIFIVSIYLYIFHTLTVLLRLFSVQVYICICF